jgi:hypothetical protein
MLLCSTRILVADFTLCFILPVYATAGTFSILDLTDRVSITDDNQTGRLEGHPCPAVDESCIFQINFPAGAVSAMSTIGIDNGVNIFEQDNTTQLSDMLTNELTCGPTATCWTFGSDPAVESQPRPGFSSMVEDATMMQPATKITYFDAGGNRLQEADTIQFQSNSDPDVPVPEPASALIALIGLAVLGIPILRRRTIISATSPAPFSRPAAFVASLAAFHVFVYDKKMRPGFARHSDGVFRRQTELTGEGINPDLQAVAQLVRKQSLVRRSNY